MRVSLQFTVDFDELPDRMIGFVREACNKYEQNDALELLTTVESLINDDNTKLALDAISDFRTKMARVDFQLEDCMNIIRDYHMAIVGEVKTNHEQQSEPPSEPSDATMSKLLGELHTLQEMTTKLGGDDDSGQNE